MSKETVVGRAQGAQGQAAQLGITAAPLQLSMQLQEAVQQMAGLIIVLERRTQALEKILGQRVTVSSIQARTLQRAVADRAKQLCETDDMEYTSLGRKIRAAIWRDFRWEYAVPSAYDLPLFAFEGALEMVHEWYSFALMRRLRKSKGA